MLATTLFIILPLITCISARHTGSEVRIESAARPDNCLSIQTFSPPKAGLTVYVGPCDGGSSQYAHSSFVAPAVGSTGAIYYNDDLCIVPEAAPAVSGGRVVLGACNDKQWTMGTNGTIASGGQCMNYDAKQFRLQTWKCSQEREAAAGKWAVVNV
jgi:hypothetical protein